MTDEEAREYVLRWKQAGPALEKVRREELRSLSHEKCFRQIDSLIAVGLFRNEVTRKSGLVEMQRVLSKARK